MNFFGAGVIYGGAQTTLSLAGAKRAVDANDQYKLVNLRGYIHARCLAIVSDNTILVDGMWHEYQ